MKYSPVFILSNHLVHAPALYQFQLGSPKDLTSLDPAVSS